MVIIIIRNLCFFASFGEQTIDQIFSSFCLCHNITFSNFYYYFTIHLSAVKSNTRFFDMI